MCEQNKPHRKKELDETLKNLNINEFAIIDFD